jgi:ABC-type branched-subunit amino acid transport system substrate-binding protein
MRFMFYLAVFVAVFNINLTAKEIIKVGVLGNSTNAISQAAINSVDLLAAQLNLTSRGYDLQTVFFDDNNPDVADRIKAAQDLCAVIGCFGEKNKDVPEKVTDVPLISLCSENVSFTTKNNTYRIIASEPEIARVTARISTVLFDRRKCAVLYEEGNTEDLRMAQSYAESARKNGADSTFVRGYTAGTTDFTPLINRIREARIKAVYFAGASADAALFCKQNYEMQTGAVLSGPSYIFDRDFIKATKDASDGCETVVKTKPSVYGYKKIKAFISSYEKKYGMKASIYTPYVHDAVSILELALDAGKRTPADINAFLKTVNYTGATGRVDFDGNGERTSPEFYFNVLRKKEMYYMPFDSEKNNVYRRAK